jgi:hypothetical protein
MFIGYLDVSLDKCLFKSVAFGFGQFGFLLLSDSCLYILYINFLPDNQKYFEY